MTVTERSPWRAGGFGISDYFKPLGVPGLIREHFLFWR